jgi:hypothetical protein
LAAITALVSVSAHQNASDQLRYSQMRDRQLEFADVELVSA